VRSGRRIRCCSAADAALKHHHTPDRAAPVWKVTSTASSQRVFGSIPPHGPQRGCARGPWPDRGHQLGDAELGTSKEEAGGDLKSQQPSPPTSSFRGPSPCRRPAESWADWIQPFAWSRSASLSTLLKGLGNPALPLALLSEQACHANKMVRPCIAALSCASLCPPHPQRSNPTFFLWANDIGQSNAAATSDGLMGTRPQTSIGAKKRQVIHYIRRSRAAPPVGPLYLRPERIRTGLSARWFCPAPSAGLTGGDPQPSPKLLHPGLPHRHSQEPLRDPRRGICRRCTAFDEFMSQPYHLMPRRNRSCGGLPPERLSEL